MIEKPKKFKGLRAIAMFILLSSILLFSYKVNSALCLPANSMWTEPDTIILDSTTPVGYKFNITVYVNLSVSSYAWQFYLTYNKAHLSATGCWYTAGAKSQWAGTNPTSPQEWRNGTHSATLNYVLFAESLQGNVETPPGNYSLAIVEFEVIAKPPEGETFQSEIRLDIPGAFNSLVLDPDLEEIPLNFAGTYIVSEFSAPMFLTVLLLASILIVLLRKKWSKTGMVHQPQS